ncbi:MAG: TIGR03905 family TSCPD domain-containing protein [Bacilli bacterium]|nr:TIGR03905 family TSCPD domain-containing protein [Bacilli bacterium]
MKIIRYIPSGVCSQLFEISYENGIIMDIVVHGGCNGNLKGISALLKNVKIEEAIKKLEGIKCGFKNTSCPDQIAQALKKCL